MTKKEKIKAGLNFGIGMMLFYILQDLFTGSIDSLFAAFRTIGSGLLGGAVSGVLFGWLIGPFNRLKLFTVKTDLLLHEAEHIVYETPASHYCGIEAVGGKLFLTNKRLIFKSHRVNIQKHQLSIDLALLSNIDRYKSLGLVNNGISFTTDNGRTEKFVVSNADEWINRLKRHISLQLEPGASGA